MLLLRTINGFCKSPASFQFSTQQNTFAVESKMNFVLKSIRQILPCSEQTALTVYEKFPSIRSVTALNRMKKNIELLTNNGVSKELIIENPFLLIQEIDVLQRKLETIKMMRPRHIDDFVPLLDMKEPILMKVAAMTANEYGSIPENNRIYYLSRELQIAPATVSKYCSQFKLIFFASFLGIAKKLNILLDYNVDGKQILQSLYIFRCADNVLISRLEDLPTNRRHDIKLWFFKCTDEKFQKVLLDEVKNDKEIAIELAHQLSRRKLEKRTILNALNEMLSCDDKVSAQIYYNFISNIEQLVQAKTNIKILTDNGVNLQIIQIHSAVLTLPNAQLTNNIELIKEMNPISIDDFLPLVEVETKKLQAFTRKVNKAQSTVPQEHPIYVFSNKLKISPTDVSKYFAKHTNIFFGDFAALKLKLHLLTSYKVRPISILKSPHTFEMSLETLESTLKDIKSQGIEQVSSWMLVCDTSRLKKVVARRVEEETSFGGSDNTVDYVANRLSWDEAAKKKALKYHPPLEKCSVIKVKAHLDYLLNETHFTVDDINSNVAVFRTKLDELKLRVNELAAIGLKPRKLYSICLSRKRYLEMVEIFCRKKNCPVTFKAFKSIEKRILRNN